MLQKRLQFKLDVLHQKIAPVRRYLTARYCKIVLTVTFRTSDSLKFIAKLINGGVLKNTSVSGRIFGNASKKA